MFAPPPHLSSEQVKKTASISNRNFVYVVSQHINVHFYTLLCLLSRISLQIFIIKREQMILFRSLSTEMPSPSFLLNTFIQKSALSAIIKQMFIIHPSKKRDREKHLLCHYHPSAFAISPCFLLWIPPLNPLHVITVICHANEPCSKTACLYIYLS